MEVLLVGNTDFITKQWIQHAFPRDHVVIAEREDTVDGNDRLRIVNMSDANTLAETITTYEFDTHRILFRKSDPTQRQRRRPGSIAKTSACHSQQANANADGQRPRIRIHLSGKRRRKRYQQKPNVSSIGRTLPVLRAHLPSGSENHSLPILVRSRLKLEGVVQCGYVKNDGERFMLTILTDNRSMDDTMWVFERKDLP